MPRLLAPCLSMLLMLPTLSLAATDPNLPAPPPWLAEVDALYDAQVRVAGLDDRKFSPEQWWEVALPLATAPRGFAVEEAGRSAEGRPLRHVSWGQGGKSVLLWSQMHGDESTASMAIADLFRFLGEHPGHPLVQRIGAGTTLHFLPVMNPDGAARFQRRNAQGIDINRDARALASPEARALHGLRERLHPDFGFNLHDQDVGTRVGDSDRGTAIALLAPAYNEAREVDATRARAIEVAVAIRAALEPYISGYIAKWDDSFNARAFGDLTAAAGVSTILIESGGIEGDLQKQQLRKLNFLALLAALDAIATGAHAGLPQARYFELPENGDTWADLLVTGATLAMPGRPPARVDVLVEFDDALLEQGGKLEGIGDLADVRARRSIDASGLYLVPFDPAKFATGAPAYFQLTRDPEGRDVVWRLAGDVDRTRPGLAASRAGTTAPELLLLGEVHDSSAGHAARLQHLQARIESGWRPAIAMEQFDREQQAALDAAMRECSDADCVIARVAPEKSGWTWAHYAPVIALALEHDLPIIAANLSRADARKVVGEGFAGALSPELVSRYRLDGLPAALLAAQATEVRDSHCGQLPEAMVEPMARAQIARDVVMAELLRTQVHRGVVLLAGNGHVRRDIGVPYWLREAGLAPYAVGFLEPGSDPAAFDEASGIPKVERPDPCAAFGKPGGG